MNRVLQRQEHGPPRDDLLVEVSLSSAREVLPEHFGLYVLAPQEATILLHQFDLATKFLAPFEEAGPESEGHLGPVELADLQLALPRARSVVLHRHRRFLMLHWWRLTLWHRLGQ